MPAVEQTIGGKAIEPDQAKIAEALNREVVPVVRRIRSVLNAELRSYAETIGNGVTTVFDIEHGLGTTDVFVAIYDIAAGTDRVMGIAYFVNRLSDSTVRVTYSLGAPTSDRVLIRV